MTAGLFHKWKSFPALKHNNGLRSPFLLVLVTTSIPSSRPNPPFPWLMTPAAIAALLVTVTFGKMAYTDVQRVPPSRVPSANVVMSL